MLNTGPIYHILLVVSNIAIYGISIYGTVVYGYTAPPAYSVDPFTSDPYNYGTINLSWVRPAGTITAWRLIKNMQGFPTDQDDGSIIIDSDAGFPGTAFSDTNVTPGAYHYYGFFVQVNTEDDLWVNAGNTGCLMLQNYGSALSMLNLIPNFYVEIANNTDELQADPIGNLFLNSLMSVFGWGLDYLRTQYDTYLNFNNPVSIPIADLYNLAAELGLDINPAVSPYTLRKAVYYNAVINKTKGTLQGLMTELSALTGWNADLSIGPNMLLSNDQSFFQDPSPAQWSPYLNYNTSELVKYSDYIYSCIESPNYGEPPSGTASPNTWWQVQQSVASDVLSNSVTGGIDTWEGVYNLTPDTVLPSGALQELTGVQDPLSTLHYNANAIQIQNLNSSASDMWLRSVSRITSDIPGQGYPDQYQAIADGIPVPSVLTATAWSATVTYFPQDIVLYNSQPFMALRTTLNSVPPYTSPGTNSEDWAPLSYNNRFRIATSAYVNGSSLPVVPFIEWYDTSGNFITRVFARNTDSGSPAALPNGVCFDSFVTGAGEELSVYTATDDGQYDWDVILGDFSISPYAGGCTYPVSEVTRSCATIDIGSADAQVGLTFVTNPESGWTTGLVLRGVSLTSYLEATMTQLVENNGGTYTVLGDYSTPCVPGDRIIVTLNGDSIIVYRNGVSVLSEASSYNSSATYFGIIYEQFSGGTPDDEYTSTYLTDYGS
jgi:hypothetical protein